VISTRGSLHQTSKIVRPGVIYANLLPAVEQSQQAFATRIAGVRPVALSVVQTFLFAMPWQIRFDCFISVASELAMMYESTPSELVTAQLPRRQSQLETHRPVRTRSDGPSSLKVRRTVILTIGRSLCNLSTIKRSEVEWANETLCKAPWKC
jgi:hypothetical protein